MSNEVHKQMMELVAQIIAHVDSLGEDELVSAHGDDFFTYATELAEQVQALDEWIKKGGFLPKVWDHRAEGEQPCARVSDRECRDCGDCYLTPGSHWYRRLQSHHSLVGWLGPDPGNEE